MASLASVDRKIGGDQPAGVFKITPKFAFAATGLILALAVLWVGVVEKQATRNPDSGPAVLISAQTLLGASGWGSDTSGLGRDEAVTAQSGTNTLTAVMPPQGRDNVSVLAFSSVGLLALAMALLAYGRYWGAASGGAVPQRAAPTPRHPRRH